MSSPWTDHHQAGVCRLGRRKYKQLESYDEWLRGGGRLWPYLPMPYPYPFDDQRPTMTTVCSLTENDDAAADTYNSDADCCRLQRRRALSTGGHSAS